MDLGLLQTGRGFPLLHFMQRGSGYQRLCSLDSDVQPLQTLIPLQHRHPSVAQQAGGRRFADIGNLQVAPIEQVFQRSLHSPPLKPGRLARKHEPVYRWSGIGKSLRLGHPGANPVVPGQRRTPLEAQRVDVHGQPQRKKQRY